MEVDDRLLQTLANLNQIGAAINRIGSDRTASIGATLCQIVESATQVVPDAAAVIYTYDEGAGEFDPASRVSAGTWERPVFNDVPRSGGLGRRAVTQRRRVLSYEETNLTIHPGRVAAGAQMLGCFPLIVAEQVVGALYVYRRTAHPFSQLELLLLDNFGNQAAMAIYHTHHLNAMQRSLTRQEEEIHHLRRAGLLISSRLRLEETLDAILQMALEITAAHYGIFRLLDKSGQFLVTGALAGEPLARPNVEILPLDTSSVMGWVACQQQPVRIADLRAGDWRGIYYPLAAGLEMRSELAVPLLNASGRLEGVLNLESPEVGAFTEDDQYLLQALAAQAVTAIQEVRLLDALQEAAGWLLTQPCQQMLARLVTLACDLLNAADSALWTLQGTELRLEAASGGYQHGERLPLQHSFVGQAVLNREAVMTDDVSTDARFWRADLARAQGWRRALVVPVMVGPDGDLLGAFSVYSANAAAGRFAESEWDKKVLTCLAHYAALALQNAARQEALRIAQERRAAAETFAVMGDVASNLLHHLNNKVGTIPVRVQGIRAKSQVVLETDAYLTRNLQKIEQCAVEALESVQESLAHLRPVQPEPVNVLDCVRAAIQSAHLPATVAVQPEDLERLPHV
ncbi:MAG TPA: GAF domain-containing protein, partial [Phototrophicaceae bacterium]|nr:GAF domain-containing protein [Phototrophicaceae bacterium]